MKELTSVHERWFKKRDAKRRELDDTLNNTTDWKDLYHNAKDGV